MGAKISIDSSTLMNKGLEVIEAHHLFDMPYDKNQRGGAAAERHPLHGGVHRWQRQGASGHHRYAHPHPVRASAIRSVGRRPSSLWISPSWEALEFAPADTDTFRCLELARHAGGVGGTLPCVMNAANEVAVAAFLAEQGSYLGIAECVEAVMDAHEREGVQKVESLEQLQALDAWARETARKSVR